MTNRKLLIHKRIRFCPQFTKVNAWLRFAAIASCLIFAFTTSARVADTVGLTKKTAPVPLILLESSEAAINQGSSSKAIAVSPTDPKLLYTLDRGTQEIVIYETQGKSSRRFRPVVRQENIVALAVGSDGNIYLADSMSSQIRVLNPAGQPISAVPVVPPMAMGILSKANMVVASSVGLDLLHLHGPTGSKLGSFGELKTFDSENHRQNRFLNEGKVVVGTSDTIYYVSTHAPIPTVRKFSTDGQLLSEFVVEGAAIDHQVSVANGFLRQKQSNLVGGFHVITSATVDPSTGHLWISMNGTSKTGVVYEYNPSGVKLREYAFVLKGSQGDSEILTGIKDMAVRGPWIYVLAWDGRVCRFNLHNSARASHPNQKPSRMRDSRG